MNWLPGFATPLAAWFFALLVPLVVLYFLKLRRPRVKIPSLALWSSVLQDQRVNSPFQKFRRNLLLMLQALALCCLVLAAMQPFLRGGTESATHLPILIDCSASMAATDAEGRTRLDLATDEVRRVIENLLPNQRLTLIAVDDSARRLTDFTNNPKILGQALDSIEVAEVESEITAGLQLAQALARTFPIESVRLYTDGNLPTRTDPGGQRIATVDFDLPYVLDFHKLPPAGPNMGITALNAQREGVAGWNVFARLEGTADAQTAAEVQLLADGIPLGSPRQVVLEPGQSERLAFRYDQSEAAQLEVRLTPDGEDSLAADNVAFLELPVSRPLSVSCPEEFIAYRHALQAIDGVEVVDTTEAEDQRASYDLVITNAQESAAIDASTFLSTGVIPSDLVSLMAKETGSAEVVDYKRDSELLRHVQFQDLQITDQVKLQPDVSNADLETRGYEVLVDGTTGPLILRKREGSVLSFHILFDPDQSTWPYRVGFPVMVSNLVETARQQAGLSEVRGTATGVLAPLSLQPERHYDVCASGEIVTSGRSDREGLLSGIRAPQTGLYDVREGEVPVRRVGVSLLSPTETSLFGVEEIQFRELQVAATEEPVDLDRPLWPTFALMAFVALLAEWWLFQRRPGGGGATP